MWYEIKWQCLEVDYDGCFGDLVPDIYECRCDTWEHAMGMFIAHINMDEVARVWWIVHHNENDANGSVMCGYTTQWGEHITLKKEKNK